MLQLVPNQFLFLFSLSPKGTKLLNTVPRNHEKNQELFDAVGRSPTTNFYLTSSVAASLDECPKPKFFVYNYYIVKLSAEGVPSKRNGDCMKALLPSIVKNLGRLSK